MRRHLRWRWLVVLAIVAGMFGDGLSARPASAQALGSVRIVIVKGDTNQRVNGACFSLTGDGVGATICDAIPTAESPGVDGLIVWGSLPVGTYTVNHSLVPVGYKRMAERQIEIKAGQETRITVRHWPGANSLRIKAVDANGKLVPDACYNIFHYPDATMILCDDWDGANDGVIRTGGLSTGTHSVLQTEPPQGYYINTTAKEVTFSGSGEMRVVSIATIKAPSTARIVITTKNPAGNLLPGGCYVLETTMGNMVTMSCDGQYDTPFDGKITFTGVRAGTYVLKLLVAPGPYQVPAPRTVQKVGGTVLQVTFKLKAL